MASGVPSLRRSVGAFMAFFWAPGCSWSPGVLSDEMDNAQDDSWRGCFSAWLYLATKPSHMGVMWMG
jgi:hypothetical protein